MMLILWFVLVTSWHAEDRRISTSSGLKDMMAVRVMYTPRNIRYPRWDLQPWDGPTLWPYKIISVENIEESFASFEAFLDRGK